MCVVSKLATFGWGLFACFVAMRAANQGSLIEVVNRYGSFVYGSLLGVFILAILTKRATARGAFWGLIAGMAAVLYVATQLPWIAFLWHNLIGAVVVVAVGMAISYTQRPESPPSLEQLACLLWRLRRLVVSAPFVRNKGLFQARNLTKRYGRLTALSDVSFSVRPGEVLGLIGPNGPGKRRCSSAWAACCRSMPDR